MLFNWVAETYFNNSSFQYEHAHSVLKHYSFKGNETVLDVGCGDGKITSDIASFVEQGRVLGVDSSPSMIEFAREEFTKHYPNLNFEIGKAEGLNYHQQFDLVVSFACLHWLNEVEQLSFLNGVKSALRNNGRAIITLYPKHPYIWGAIEETINAQPWQHFFQNYQDPHTNYSIQRYKELIIQAGLTIDFIKESIPVAYFDSYQKMEDFLRSWLPHTDRVIPELQDTFISAIGENFINKITLDEQERIGMPFRRLDISLIKSN